MFDVATTQGDTFSLTNKKDKSVIHVANSLVSDMKYTAAMGISTIVGDNTTYPVSWADAIKREDTLTFTLWQCLKWAPSGTCKFEPTALNSNMVEENHPMIGMVESTEVAQVESSTCPSGECYRCSWNTANPQCIKDPKGSLDLKDCQEECKPAAYGKCNFDTSKCEVCKPGAADPDCI